LLAKVEEIKRRNTCTVAALPNVPPHPNEAIRIFEWQRLNKDGIHQTKDCGICSYTQRERDESNTSESRSLQ
jgi:hypothetical protein